MNDMRLGGRGACAIAIALFAIGCGDDGADKGPDGSPPELEHPPSVTIGEGRTVTVELSASDPDGDEVTVEIAPPDGIEAALGPDASMSETPASLVLHAALGAGPGALTITAIDEGGKKTSAELAIDVTPLAWTERVEWSSEEGPEAREHATLLVDDASGSVYVMFGSGYAPYLEPLGDAWRFDVTSRTWTEVTLDGDVPSPGGSRKLAGRRGSGEGVIFGGYGEGQENFSEVYRVVADGDVLHFEEIPQENPPGERLLHLFAYDPGTETFVLFGGGSNSALEGDTQTMKIVDGVAVWTEIDPGGTSATPEKRFGAFYGMDEELGRLVLFSGQTSFTDQFGQDTWILDMRAEDGPKWTEVTPPESPEGRRNGTSVWDPTGQRLFVFGGTSDGATSQPGLFAFDARPGREAWYALDRQGQPTVRSSGFGTFVATDDAVWMGFGNDDGVYRDFTRLGY